MAINTFYKAGPIFYLSDKEMANLIEQPGTAGGMKATIIDYD
jgi:hypothetical protein